MFKVSLYFHTLKFMKPSQVYFRLKKMAKKKCSLKCQVREFNCKDIFVIQPLISLDYDPDFLLRFSAEEIMENRVSFLHSSREFQWDEEWDCQDQSALWNFNLHYFEYLFVLLDAYKKTNRLDYLNKSKQCILSWIRWNPIENGGDGWSAYTIALRLTVWLDYYAELQTEIEIDKDFKSVFLQSIYDQYVYLSNHLEKDLLGNHYFEDLKTLVLCAIFFKDDNYLQCVLKEFKNQCREQILEDGMHFELSPMYHKLIFEDIMRVAWALRCSGMQDQDIESYLQPMIDVTYSLEDGIKRTPLFNDGGNNVAKSLNALISTANECFRIVPIYKSDFPASGYYIFKRNNWKLIVDAGQPGPTYLPGHAHCDAMSFELFNGSNPQIVNCGTFAYQCKERSFFRGTSAHNSVMVDHCEQSQCWSSFRMAKRSKVKVLEKLDESICIEMIDQKKHRIVRTISFNGDNLTVRDVCKGHKISAFYHFLPEFSSVAISCGGGID